MEASTVVFIGGFYLFACGVKFVMDPKALPNIMKEVIKNEAISVLSAILPLIMGLILLGSFGPHYAVSRLDALVVVMGLFITVSGLFRLWCKKTWHNMVNKMNDPKAPHVPMWLLPVIGIIFMLISIGIIPLG